MCHHKWDGIGALNILAIKSIFFGTHGPTTLSHCGAHSRMHVVSVAPTTLPTVGPILVYTWYPSLSGWKRGLRWVVGPSTNLVWLVGRLEIAPPTRGVGNPIRVVSCHWLEWGQAILLSSLQLSFSFFYTLLLLTPPLIQSFCCCCCSKY